MKASEVRAWLGLYSLLLTLILGGYVLLFSETPLLPISKQDGTSAFEIVIPVLVGQLTLMFQWFANPPSGTEEPRIRIAPWIVKAPPIGVTVLLVITLGVMIAGNRGDGQPWAPSGEAFKGIVTFAVTILNSTTFVIVAQYFKSSSK